MTSPGAPQPGYPAPGWGPVPPGQALPQPRTNQLAIAAIICAGAQVFCWLLTGIPAIILGHMARRQIRQTGENGDGLALAGLILGYIGVAVGLLVLILMIGLFVSFRARTYSYSVNG